MDTSAETAAIVVGVDGSPPSISALQKAAELSAPLGLPIEAVTVWHFPATFDGSYSAAVWSPEKDAQEILDAALSTAFPDGAPEGLTSTVVSGPTASALIEKSKTAAMLVLGSRGRGGFAGLRLGSVSAACSQHAHCPVLIMRDTPPA